MPFIPLVKGATNTQSPNVATILDAMSDGTYYVPDFQRDSVQWDIQKRSLFIESLLNNMTVPPLIIYPEDDPATGQERCQIIDGQQRLTTIRDFVSGQFALGLETDVDYALNVGPLIQGRKYSGLPPEMQQQIRRYIVNLIVLPKGLDLSLRLEIFRRINEGGVPLSAHDLRLAVFGQSPRVYFIRLAGVFDPGREGSSRMISAGRDLHGLTYPWKDNRCWKTWWSDSAHATGQAPSQAILYHVLAKDLTAVDNLIASEKTHHNLNLGYDKTINSVLDLYLAQLEAEDQNRTAMMLANLETLKKWVTDFETWFNVLKGAKVPRISVNSSTKVSFFVAAATNYWTSPDELTETQWEEVQFFLTKGPTEIKQHFAVEYVSTRGKWPTQRTQIQQTEVVCRKIAGK